MNTVKPQLLLTLFLACSLSAFAQEPRMLSLKEAVEYAKQNNPSLKNARIDEQIAHEKVKEVTSMGLPQISANVDYTGTPQIPTQVVPNFFQPGGPPLEFQLGVPHSLTAKAQLNQLIFDGTFFLGLKASSEFVKLSTLLAVQSQQDVEINVTRSYYMVLITQENQRLVEGNIATLDRTFNDTKALFESGFVEKIDVDRLSLSLSNLRSQKNKLSDQYELVLKLLKLDMGMPLTENIQLADNLTAMKENVTAVAAEVKANYGARVEYQSLQQQLIINDLTIRRYRVGYLPSLYGFLQHQQSTFAFKNEFNTLGDKFYGGTLFGFSLKVPIFDGFNKSALIQQSKLEMNKTQNNLKSYENLIDIEVFESKSKYLRAVDEIENQQKNVELAESIYNISNEKLKEGVGSTLELTTAENDRKIAQTNYLNAIYDLLVAEIEFKKAMGQTISK